MFVSRFLVCKIKSSIYIKKKKTCSCTGYFRKVYRSLQVWVPHNILKYLYILKLPQKQFIYQIHTHTKKNSFSLFNNIYKYMSIYTYIHKYMLIYTYFKGVVGGFSLWHSFKVALGNIIYNYKKMILSQRHSTNGSFGGKVGGRGVE